jgi:hypothetical protein
LADGFRKVVLVCAGACLASSLSALLLVRREAKPEA